ncbi:TetR/AcrR family transcriptional regulator [Bradyrhizobium sp. 200]|uniref:TetR/AcrR family transcriptional regulator n=1 Tax=Bradyrhizobium sp. 200 TaxID=2782665 RepID=UPI003209CF47
MKLAGLTHGGFYNHFESRAALVSEAIAFAMDQRTGRWKKLANGKADGNASRRWSLIILVPGIATILNTVARFQPWPSMSHDRVRASSRPWLPNWRK